MSDVSRASTDLDCCTRLDLNEDAIALIAGHRRSIGISYQKAKKGVSEGDIMK